MPAPTSTNPIALAEARLRWLDHRQEVLARNISHADTPGYRARDLQPFAAHLARGTARLSHGVARTDPRHLQDPRGAHPGEQTRPAQEVSPNGNGVSLDDQAIKVAETDSAHAVATGLHRRWLTLFRTALGRNG